MDMPVKNTQFYWVSGQVTQFHWVIYHVTVFMISIRKFCVDKYFLFLPTCQQNMSER